MASKSSLSCNKSVALNTDNEALISKPNPRKRQRTASSTKPSEISAEVLNDDSGIENGKSNKIICIRRGRGRPRKNLLLSTAKKLTTKSNRTVRVRKAKELKLNQEETLNKMPTIETTATTTATTKANKIAFDFSNSNININITIPRSTTIVTRRNSTASNKASNLNKSSNLLIESIKAATDVVAKLEESDETMQENKLISTVINSNKPNRSKSFNKPSNNLQKNKIHPELLLIDENTLKPLSESSTKPNVNNNKKKTQSKILNNNNNFSNNNNNNINNNLLNDDLHLFYKNYTAKKLINEANHINDENQENNECALNTNIKSPLPDLNWTNSEDLWKTMHLKTIKYKHDLNYLKKHLNIQAQMRAVLIDWLIEICYAYRLHRETFHLAVEYMDRFMTLCKNQMQVDRLQLVGLTSLFLAAKVEEIYPPKLKEFSSHMEQYSSNNEDAIEQFELFMLKTLNWEISPVTANTWLMTYLQIASIKYYSIISKLNKTSQQEFTEATSNQSNLSSQTYDTHIVMPLNIYKNSQKNNTNNKKDKSTTSLGDNTNLEESTNEANEKFTSLQQTFYLKNYMKSITLLDLCLFDIESLKFNYSLLAASALHHMISIPSNSNTNNSNVKLIIKTNNSLMSSIIPSNSNLINSHFIQECTGYEMNDLDACIKWMSPYADACKIILTEDKMTTIRDFKCVNSDDAHNIQLYYQNLDILKIAQSRKTPNQFEPCAPILLTPPGSVHKYTITNDDNSPY